MIFVSHNGDVSPQSYQTGHLPIEDPKLDSLRPGSREMERGR